VRAVATGPRKPELRKPEPRKPELRKPERLTVVGH